MKILILVLMWYMFFVFLRYLKGMVNKINYKFNFLYFIVILKNNNVDELWNLWEIMYVMV